MPANKPPFDGEWVKVAEVFNLQMGKTPSRKKMEYWNTGEYDWVSIKDLGSYGRFVGRTKETISELGRIESGIKQVPANTLLMSFKLSLGKTSITTRPIYTNEAIMAFLDKGTFQFDLGYMWHQFRTKDWATGTNMAVMGETLNKKTLGSALIRLPDLRTQRLVASCLDVIQSQLEIAGKKLECLDILVKSRFVEMFGGLNSADLRPLKDVCSIITDGTHQPPKFVDRGIPFLFVSNITSDAVDYETNKFISVEDYEQLIRRTPIEVGDVLVSAVGSFGHPAIVEDDRPFCFQRHIAYLKPRHDLIDSSYLHAALLSEGSQRYMDRCAKGAAQRTVTLKSFKEMKVPLPPLALQQEFASFVAEVDKSRFIVKQKIEKLQMLYDSLAQEYFG